jgi:glycosyltransferase involved in cell wall biosynthesis
MTDWPSLAILVITYNRVEILRETLLRLERHLDYAGQRRVFVADDGSDDGTQAMVLEEFPDAVLVSSDRRGLGSNANAGLRHAWSFSDYVYQSQDDLHLLHHFDLHPHIEQLRDDPTCGFVRLWGVGGHRYKGNLEGNHWRIHWDSDELYIPSDRPHVKHRRFHEHFGLYPEGLKTAHTEEAFCHQCKGRAGLEGRQLDVFVPHAVDIEKNFEHAGWHTRWRDVGL